MHIIVYISDFVVNFTEKTKIVRLVQALSQSSLLCICANNQNVPFQEVAIVFLLLIEFSEPLLFTVSQNGCFLQIVTNWIRKIQSNQYLVLYSSMLFSVEVLLLLLLKYLLIWTNFESELLNHMCVRERGVEKQCELPKIRPIPPSNSVYTTKNAPLLHTWRTNTAPLYI